MPAEPSIEPAFIIASKLSGISISSGVSIGADAPPGMTAFNLRSPLMPPQWS